MSLSNGDAQTQRQIFFAQCPFFKITLHQGFVVFGSSFYDDAVHVFGAGLFGSRDRVFFWFASTIGKEVHHHAECIDDGIETNARIERVLKWDDFGPKAGNRLFKCGIKICFFVVNLVDHKNCGGIKGFDVFPEQLCTYFYPTSGVVDEYCRSGYPESRNHLADVIVQTWRVDEVDFGIFPGNVLKG